MHESDGGWTVTGARSVRGGEKTIVRASGALFRVYNHSVVGRCRRWCTDITNVPGELISQRHSMLPYESCELAHRRVEAEA